MAGFTIVSGGFKTAEFEVHAAGCADLTRAKYRLANQWTVDAHSAEALVAAEAEHYESQDQGWTAADHRIMPCAKTKKAKAAASKVAGLSPAEKAWLTRRANAAAQAVTL